MKTVLLIVAALLAYEAGAAVFISRVIGAYDADLWSHIASALSSVH